MTEKKKYPTILSQNNQQYVFHSHYNYYKEHSKSINRSRIPSTDHSEKLISNVKTEEEKHSCESR